MALSANSLDTSIRWVNKINIIQNKCLPNDFVNCFSCHRLAKVVVGALQARKFKSAYVTVKVLKRSQDQKGPRETIKLEVVPRIQHAKDSIRVIPNLVGNIRREHQHFPNIRNYSKGLLRIQRPGVCHESSAASDKCSFFSSDISIGNICFNKLTK